MIYVIVICIGSLMIFLIRYFILKQQINSFLKQLRDRQKQKLQISSNSRLIEELAVKINEIISEYEKERVEKIRLDREIKQAIASMSHDLRTPLTAISGYIELLENDSLQEEEKAHYLAIIKKRTRHLEQLIDNFFALSTVDTETYPLEKKKVHINSLLKETLIAYYDAFVSENKKVEIDLTSNSLTILVDENALRRVLENLLLNALQHSASRIFIALDAKDDHVFFSIQNNISENSLDPEQLFEPFYTVDQTRQYNRGLGLPIVKNLMDKMGGELLLKIEDGEFAITCLWPLHRGA